MTTEAAVRAALEEVPDPCSVVLGRPVSLAGLGLLESVAVEGSRVRIELVLTMPNCPMYLDIASRVQQAVGGLEGVDEVDVRLNHDIDWSEDRLPADARERLVHQRSHLRRNLGVKPRGIGDASRSRVGRERLEATS